KLSLRYLITATLSVRRLPNTVVKVVVVKVRLVPLRATKTLQSTLLRPLLTTTYCCLQKLDVVSGCALSKFLRVVELRKVEHYRTSSIFLKTRRSRHTSM